MSNCIVLKKGGASIAANQIKAEVSRILGDSDTNGDLSLDVAIKILSDFNIIAKTNSEAILSVEDILSTVEENVQENKNEVPDVSSDASVASVFIDSNDSFITVRIGNMTKEYSKVDYMISTYRMNSYLDRAKDIYFQLRYEYQETPFEALEDALEQLSNEMDDRLRQYEENPLETGFKLKEDGSVDESVVENFRKDLEVIDEALDSKDLSLLIKLVKTINNTGIESINVSYLNEKIRDKILKERQNQLELEESESVFQADDENVKEYIQEQDIAFNKQSLSAELVAFWNSFDELKKIETTEEEIQNDITNLEDAFETENAEGKKFDRTRGEEKPRIDPFIAARLASIAKKTFDIKDGKIISYDAVNSETGFKMYADMQNLLRIIIEDFAQVKTYSDVSGERGNTDVYDKLKDRIAELAKIDPTFNNILDMLNEFGNDKIAKSKFVTSLYLENINYIDIYKDATSFEDGDSSIDIVETNKYNRIKAIFGKKLANIFRSRFVSSNKELKLKTINSYRERLNKIATELTGTVEDVYKVSQVLNTIMDTEITPISIYNVINENLKGKSVISNEPNTVVARYLREILGQFTTMFFNNQANVTEISDFGPGIFSVIMNKYLKVSREQSDNMLIGPNGKVYSKANASYSERFLDQLINKPSNAQKKYLGLTSGIRESGKFLWAKSYAAISRLNKVARDAKAKTIKTITVLQDKVKNDSGIEDYKTRKNRTGSEFATNQLSLTLNYLKNGKNFATYPNASDKSVNNVSLGEENTLLDDNGGHSFIVELNDAIKLVKEGKTADLRNTNIFKRILNYSEAEVLRFIGAYEKLNDSNETTNNVMGKVSPKQYPYIVGDKIVYLTKKEGTSLGLEQSTGPVRLKGFVKVIGKKGDLIIKTNTLQEAIDLGLTDIKFLGNAFSNFFYDTTALEDADLFEKDKDHGYYKPKDYDNITSYLNRFRSSKFVQDRLNKELNSELRQIEEYLVSNKIIKTSNEILEKLSEITKEKDQNQLRSIYMAAASMKYKLDQIERSYLYGGGVEYYKNVNKDNAILSREQNQGANVSVDYFKRIYALSSSGIRPYFPNGESSKVKVLIVNDVVYQSEMAEDTDATNGGGYIHYLEAIKFRERIGKLTKKEKDIIKRLRKGEEVSDNEMKFLFQPIKPFFFNLETSGPLLIKNAWTILTPWLGKNTSLPVLTKLYNTMENTGIRMILPSSNIKVGIHDAIDISNDFSGNKYDIIDFLEPKNSIYREQLLEASFDIDGGFFIEHTATPEHGVHEMNLPRGIVENMMTILEPGTTVNMYDSKTRSYKSVDALTVKENLTIAIEQLRDIQVKKIYSELGLVVDENGEVIAKENFAEKQREFAKKYLIDENTTQDIIDAIESGTPLMSIIPLQNIILNKLSSIARKAVNTVQMLGGQLIQSPQWGFLAPNNIAAQFGDLVGETSNGQYYFKKGNESQLEEKGVKFFKNGFNGVQKKSYEIQNKNGKQIVTPFECLCSTNYIRNQIPELANATDETIMAMMENKPEIRRVLASRIPNQAVASNNVMEIVGILPQSMGDTIVSYLDMTRLTGSDFDIDKLYTIFPYVKLKNGELQLITPKFGEKATQKQLSNYILQTFIQLGMDERIREEYFKKSIDTSIKEDIIFNGFKEAPKNLSEYTKGDVQFLPTMLQMPNEAVYKEPIYSSRNSEFNMFTLLHQIEVEESAMQAKELLGRLVVMRKSLMSMVHESIAYKGNVPFAEKFSGNEKFTKLAYRESRDILGKIFELAVILSEETNLTADNMKLIILPKININSNTTNIWTASLAHTLNPELVCCLFTQKAMQYYSQEKSNLVAAGNIVEAGDETLQKIVRNKILKHISSNAILDRMFNVETKLSTSKNNLYSVRIKENVDWSDITLDLSENFDTDEEKLTKKVAGDKYISEHLNEDNNANQIADSLYEQIKIKGKITNIKLNVTGNDIYILKKSQNYYNDLIIDIIKKLQNKGVIISEIRSGGKTGIDEAGIIAAQRLFIPNEVHTTSDFMFRDKSGNDISSEEEFKKRFGIFNVNSKDIHLEIFEKKGGMELVKQYSEQLLSNNTYLPLKAVSIQRNKYESLKIKGETNTKEFRDLDKYFKSLEYAALQLAVLENIVKLDVIGDIDSKFILGTKTNITNKEPYSLIISILNYNSFINVYNEDSQIYKPEDYFFTENGSAKFEAVFSLYSQRDILNVFKSFYPEFETEMVQVLLEQYRKITGHNINNSKEIKAIYDIIKLHTLMTGFDLKTGSDFSFYIKQSMSNQDTIFDDHLKVLELFRQYQISNSIISNIAPNGYGAKWQTNEKGDKQKSHPTIYRFELLSSRADKISKDELVQGMRQLIFFKNSNMTKEENQLIRKFGKDLAIQALLTSNGKFSPFSLKEYIPMDFYKAIGYTQKLDKIFSSSVNVDMQSAIVASIKNGDVKVPFFAKENFAQGIEVTPEINGKKMTNVIKVSDFVVSNNNAAKFDLTYYEGIYSSLTSVSKYIKTNVNGSTELYELIGFKKYEDTESKPRLSFYYIKSDKQGIKDGAFDFTEYNYEDTSIFRENQVNYNIPDVGKTKDEIKQYVIDNIDGIQNEVNMKQKDIVDMNEIIDILKDIRTKDIITEENAVETYKDNCN